MAIGGVRHDLELLVHLVCQSRLCLATRTIFFFGFSWNFFCPSWMTYGFRHPTIKWPCKRGINNILSCEDAINFLPSIPNSASFVVAVWKALKQNRELLSFVNLRIRCEREEWQQRQRAAILLNILHGN